MKTTQSKQTFTHDVIVVGGGPAGICAAIAAGRMGARTLLIEKQTQLGGMGTNALVNNFCNAHYDGTRFIIGGIFAEVRDELIRRGGLFSSNGLEPYNHVIFLEIVERLCSEAGVELALGSGIVATQFDDTEADVRVRLKDGRTFRAHTLVDASGDAVVAQMAGAPFWSRSSNGRGPMPLTYCYLFGPVDIDGLRAGVPDSTCVDKFSGEDYIYLGPQPVLKEWIREAREAGELTIPRERIAVAYSVPGSPEVLSVNFGRVVIEDPADPQQLADAEKRGLAQVEEGAAFLRTRVPGCEAGEVIELARQIGVRESRQIKGLYRLDRDDVLQARQFDDVIAQCCYAIDIHEPDTDRTTMIAVPEGGHYDIPLRCLVPASGPSNLIVAGRSISATQEAMSSFRVSPSVMAIGQAAGVAAVLAAWERCAIRDVPASAVQAELLHRGAILN